MIRRELIKCLSLLPFGDIEMIKTLRLRKTNVENSPKFKRDIIKELGLRTFINAAGTYTFNSASLMHPEVLESIEATSKHFIMLNEVQDRVGEKIANLCHAESAMVTAGCWSAMVIGTAGVLTGLDQTKVEQLPNINGFGKSEVIVQKSHNVGYMQALKNTGIIPILIETREELLNAISDRTALMWFLNKNNSFGQLNHEEWVGIAKQFHIPTMIDIAADIPPVENLWKYNDIGFDLVCVSGGKAIAGPQSTGILMGKKNLISAARLNACPHGGIGRGHKVNKEDIIGMYVALEKYINLDHKAEWQMWEERVKTIVTAIKKIPGIHVTTYVPPVANHTPTIAISWDSFKIKMTTAQLINNLRVGTPSIEVMPDKDSLNLSVFMLKDGEDKIVAGRIHQELSKALTS